jgi:hypothetical protein
VNELQGLLVLAVGLGGLAAAASLAASTLRLRSSIEYCLAVYLLAWAWLLALTLALSAAGLVTRWSLLAGVAAGLLVSRAAWRASGQPRPPSFRPALAALRDALRHPAVLVLAVAVAAGSIYSVALALSTPVNDWDALTYQLARAALWKQQNGVGYVVSPADLRLNANPPGAEIAQLATMVFAGSDRYVSLVPLFAYAALVLGVAGVARRIGLETREAAFGALAVATLPVIVLQASSGLNDLVVASFLLAAAFFALGTVRAAPALFALAIALAVGTKLTAPLALPTLALVAAVGRPQREWPKLLLAGVAGVLAGSVWNVVNLAETGEVDGGLAEAAEQRAELAPAPVVASAARLAVGFLDLSGTRWPGLVFFLLAAGAVAALGLLQLRRRSGHGLALLATAGLTAVWLLAVRESGDVALRAVYKTWSLLGKPDFASFEGDWAVSTTADPLSSWYGPLAPLLLGVGTVTVVALCLRGTLPRVALALAAAPWVLLLTMALLLVWDPFRGRFLIFGIALAGATWGVLVRSTALAAATAAIGSTALLLVLVNHDLKPSGLPFSSASPRSVWDRPRWEVQALAQSDAADVLRFMEEQVPADAGIGLVFRRPDLISPYFGARLGRSVSLVPAGGVIPPEIDWLVLGTEADARRCPAAWKREVRAASGLRVERRIDRDDCRLP